METLIALPRDSRIHGVVIQPLKQLVDARGAVMHMIRCDDPLFSQFGEIYFSEIRSGTVKAWKRHREMTQHLAAPSGKIRLVIYDERPESPSFGIIEELEIGRPSAYYLVRIPPMLWYGFQSIGGTDALLANCADLPHDPDESESHPHEHSHIPYTWASET